MANKWLIVSLPKWHTIDAKSYSAAWLASFNSMFCSTIQFILTCLAEYFPPTLIHIGIFCGRMDFSWIRWIHLRRSVSSFCWFYYAFKFPLTVWVCVNDEVYQMTLIHNIRRKKHNVGSSHIQILKCLAEYSVTNGMFYVRTDFLWIRWLNQRRWPLLGQKFWLTYQLAHFACIFDFILCEIHDLRMGSLIFSEHQS